MRLIDLIMDIFVWILISIIACLLGGGIAWIFQGKSMAFQLVLSYAYYFNGIFIVGTSYGVFFFIKKTYPSAFIMLCNVVHLPEELNINILKSYSRVENPLFHHGISAAITIIGGIILFQCGYPLEGFSKYFLAVTSISLFYIGGLMFSYLIFTVLIFRKLDDNYKTIRFQKNTEFVELENLNIYLTTLFLASVIALYLAFRGTLTANFTFENALFNEGIRKFLLYPLVIFLPFVLFSGFYIRYVLRKIHMNGLTDKVNDLYKMINNTRENKSANIKQYLELEKTVLEIKEKLFSKSNTISLLSIKDSPSIIISIALIIQFLYQNDSTIQSFINTVLGK